jgi:hypothetical protein
MLSARRAVVEDIIAPQPDTPSHASNSNAADTPRRNPDCLNTLNIPEIRPDSDSKSSDRPVPALAGTQTPDHASSVKLAATDMPGANPFDRRAKTSIVLVI